MRTKESCTEIKNVDALRRIKASQPSESEQNGIVRFLAFIKWSCINPDLYIAYAGDCKQKAWLTNWAWRAILNCWNAPLTVLLTISFDSFYCLSSCISSVNPSQLKFICSGTEKQTWVGIRGSKASQSFTNVRICRFRSVVSVSYQKL